MTLKSVKHMLVVTVGINGRKLADSETFPLNYIYCLQT